MPRLRPTRVFAAAIVTVAGCGVLEGEPIDAGGPPDEEWIDCEENPYEGNCNPPQPDGGPDAEPPVCISQGSGCAECTPSVALSVTASPCTTAVCAADPTCCTTLWDERCIDLADARCDPAVRCVDTLAVGGVDQWASATWDGTDFVVSAYVPLQHQGHWGSFAWSGWEIGGADYTGIFRGQGLNNGFYFPSGLNGGALGGRRVRWADVSGDGLVDLVVSGGRGAYWGGETLAPTSDGAIGDFVITDLDGDLDLDLIISFFAGHGTRLYRRGVGFTSEPGSVGPDAHAMELCDLDGDGAREVLHVQGDRLAAYRLDNGLGAAVFPDVLGVHVDATCGDLDGDGHDEIVATHSGGPVTVIDGAGQVVWSSPEALEGSGVDTGDLDGDGDADLVISTWGPDARIHVYWNRGETPLAFDHLEGPILGDDLGRLDLTALNNF